MKLKRSLGGRLALSCALLALVAAVPAFAVEAVQNGADLWHTATGFTFTSFADNPIPAGFFCEGSKAFRSTINLRGVPLATTPAGALGEIDTIIRRLDNASFNNAGEAKTRIQLLALSLGSVKPVDTGCGLYDVTASLAGEQPVTEMKILRTSDFGGSYIAPLDLKVKLVFTPVSGKGERREVTNRITLGPGSRSVWAYAKGAAKAAVKHTGNVLVDTDGDHVPDTMMPASSNFVAGVSPAAADGDVSLCADQSCHCSTKSIDPKVPNSYCEHLHCIDVLVDCSQPIAPVRPGPPPPDGSSDGSSDGSAAVGGNNN
ncbi:MAG TPA: hypothetical protein VGS07_13720 [Thermoanaerobaculia bacterium]|jgi:hypothetical protein|nr:hypothetical protein [Thermoanaerobaculia bacterium]